MKKQLIQAGNLDEFICRASGKLYLDGMKILTPGARDELARRNIAIVNGPAPDAGASGDMPRDCAVCASSAGQAGFERLMLGVAVLLKEEYGIADPAELRALSLRAVKIIKDNI